MKRFLLLLATVVLFGSCATRLTEKVESSFPNGQARLVRYYDKNNTCLKEVEYYETGQVKMEGAMKGNQREGEWKSYFPDGRMQSIGSFKDDKRTGPATVWQENGNLLQEGFYKDGQHCGHWKFYDEQGNLVGEKDYGKCE